MENPSWKSFLNAFDEAVLDTTRVIEQVFNYFDPYFYILIILQKNVNELSEEVRRKLDEQQLHELHPHPQQSSSPAPSSPPPAPSNPSPDQVPNPSSAPAPSSVPAPASDHFHSPQQLVDDEDDNLITIPNFQDESSFA